MGNFIDLVIALGAPLTFVSLVIFYEYRKQKKQEALKPKKA
jgi:uncharacterized membrane protein